MPELDQGASPPPPLYKIGSPNTPYKLGLTTILPEDIDDKKLETGLEIG